MSIDGINTNDINNHDYIKLSTMRDPVLAADDYIYEREAIVKWISDVGISPFTEQLLDIRDLKSADTFQRILESHRCEQLSQIQDSKSADSSPLLESARYEQPSYQGPAFHMNKPVPITPPEDNYPDKEGRSAPKSSQKCFIAIISLLIFLILGIAIAGFMYYSTGKDVTSKYSKTVTANSPTYFVNQSDRYGSENVMYRYEKIRIMISASGLYTFKCNIDNIQHFVYIGTIDLYKNSFNSENLSMNRLAYEYSDEGIHKNSFEVLLESGDYILVISLIGTYEKSVSVSITGPASVTFT